MNRLKETAECINQLVRQIVWHPSKLQTRVRTVGPSTVVFIKAVKEDTGKLIGSGGVVFNALNKLAGILARDSKVEVVVDEPTESFNAQAEAKDGKESRVLLERMGNLIFGEATYEWDGGFGSEMVAVSVAGGWDADFIEEVNEVLSVVFGAVGRAGKRTFKVWVTERAAKV